MDYTNLRADQELTETGLVYEVESLYAYLHRVRDTRKAKGKRYRLIDLLVTMVLAKLCGEDHPSGIADWVAHRVDQLYELKVLSQRRAPSHMTYRRVLQNILQPQALEQLISEYQQGNYAGSEGSVIRIDGKSLRGSIRAGEWRGTHLLSAFVAEQGIVLCQAEVDGKENEIVVAPKLLGQLDLQGAIVMGDAMHAQRETSQQIVRAGGAFIWTIKGNQPRTEWAIEKLFAKEVGNLKQGAPVSDHCRQFTHVNKGHGRIEKRSILVSTDLNDYLNWPHIAQVFRIEREVHACHSRGRTRQVAYGLTSLSPQEASAQRLLTLNRSYWSIENGLHYRRDVTLHEDATRLTVGNAAHSLAILNNLVISLCLRAGFQNLAKARRRFNAKIEQALLLILHKNFSFL